METSEDSILNKMDIETEMTNDPESLKRINGIVFQHQDKNILQLNKAKQIIVTRSDKLVGTEEDYVRNIFSTDIRELFERLLSFINELHKKQIHLFTPKTIHTVLASNTLMASSKIIHQIVRR